MNDKEDFVAATKVRSKQRQTQVASLAKADVYTDITPTDNEPLKFEPLNELEIVFPGLCSFINMRNCNGTLPPPCVVLPQTPDAMKHIPFIAFGKADVRVEKLRGSANFTDVEFAPDFSYLPLNGVDIRLLEDLRGFPRVLRSYELIAHKDDYWPEAKNCWDERYFPGEDGRPDEHVVAAFMPIGGGTIAAERLTDFEWEFRNEDGLPTTREHYAQEVIYRIYPFRHENITLVLTRFDRSAKEPDVFRFYSQRKNVKKIKLWIGNSDSIHRALLRISGVPRKAIHFEHLNYIASLGRKGPIPCPVVPWNLFQGPNLSNIDDPPGGGSDTGYCGPNGG